jgi:hypothetical protein
LTLNFNGSFKRTIENNTLYYVSCNSQRIYETPSHNLYQLLGRCFTSQDIKQLKQPRHTTREVVTNTLQQPTPSHSTREVVTNALQ